MFFPLSFLRRYSQESLLDEENSLWVNYNYGNRSYVDDSSKHAVPYCVIVTNANMYDLCI